MSLTDDQWINTKYTNRIVRRCFVSFGSLVKTTENHHENRMHGRPSFDHDAKVENTVDQDQISLASVNGGAKLSNYGGIKSSTYLKNLLHVWTFFPVHHEKF